MRIASLLALVALSGCATSGPELENGIPVEKAAHLRNPLATPPSVVMLQDKPSGHTRYSRPVLDEPSVFAVWVPEHVDREMDMKIGGHWVYFRLSEATWHVAGSPQQSQEPNPPVTAEQGDAPIHPDLKRGLGRQDWVVPYRQLEQTRHEPEEKKDDSWD